MSDVPVSPMRALVPAIEFPAETLRLIVEYRDLLRRDGKSWADYAAGHLRRKVEDSSFLGLLWTGPGDEAVGLAGWERAGTLGRRGFLYLAEGYQRRVVLEEFLHRLEASVPPDLPFVSWADEVPGVSDGDRAAVFGGRGFSPAVRSDMHLPKGRDPPRPPPRPGFAPRSLTVADESLIADLLFRAYAESPERALFATTLDQREDARLGTHDLLHGNVGRWLPDASFGIEEGGRLIAHTLANELEGGLITEVGVDPSFRRQGLARQLLPATIGALRAAGFEVPRLVVTRWNAAAVRLYKSLGFEFVPGGSGRVWLNLTALGVASAPPTEL
ncbi:MAG: GNAT family N-acetyltransferase [Thermoplasmata archaeon]